MIDDIESMIDGADLGLLMGVGPTTRHERKVSGEITPPVKIGNRGARWPKFEGLLFQKAILAELNKGQRVAIATYLEGERRTTKSAREIFDGGLTMIADFIDANAKAEAA